MRVKQTTQSPLSLGQPRSEALSLASIVIEEREAKERERESLGSGLTLGMSALPQDN